ncbi:hypothetical protein Q428_04110 [Fervidicella metallireducens AeB]|uniref:EAL domain-containing protein n=2 Tax=Fervidicella TaxID=1403538 RepID=A0A017RWL9_9CLOT|nr:hypothetical protein Q428_04110 [Fervidicella metallireducens AeB]
MNIASKMGIEVIAEGVENKEQYNTLKEIGVEKFQGYYISKPKEMDKLLIDIKKHNSILCL